MYEAPISQCLPDRLHPASEMFLTYYLKGEMTTAEFIRWFHMPNSDYLEVGRCIVRAIMGQ